MIRLTTEQISTLSQSISFEPEKTAVFLDHVPTWLLPYTCVKKKP